MTIPSSTRTGDLMLLATGTYNGQTAGISGWTIINSNSGFGTYQDFTRWFYRVAQAGDAGSTLSVPLSQPAYAGTTLIVLNGQAGTSPVHASGIGTGAASTTIQSGSVTTSARTHRFFLYSQMSNLSNVPNFTTPSGLTLIQAPAGSSGYHRTGVYWKTTWDDSGTLANVNLTSDTSGGQSGITVAIEPDDTFPYVIGFEDNPGGATLDEFSYSDGGSGTWVQTATPTPVPEGSYFYRNTQQVGSHQKRWGSRKLNRTSVQLAASVRCNGNLNPWSNGNSNTDPLTMTFYLYNETTATQITSRGLPFTVADLGGTGNGASVSSWARKYVNITGLTSGNVYSVYGQAEGWAGRYLIDIDWIEVTQAGPSGPTLNLPAQNDVVAQPVTLTWTHSDPDGTAQVQYQPAWRRVATDGTPLDSWTVGTNVTSSTASHTFSSTQFLPGTRYEWTVRTYDGSNWGDWTNYPNTALSGAPEGTATANRYFTIASANRMKMII